VANHEAVIAKIKPLSDLMKKIQSGPQYNLHEQSFNEIAAKMAKISPWLNIWMSGT